MKYYACTDAPFEICGLDVIDPAEKRFWRLADEDAAAVSDAVRSRSKTACGGRIRFRTNAVSIRIRISLHTLGVDLCIPLPGSAGLDVYTGTGINAMYRGYVCPLQYGEENKTQEKDIWLQPETKSMVQVTLNLPRNEQLAGVEIGIPEDAELLLDLLQGNYMGVLSGDGTLAIDKKTGLLVLFRIFELPMEAENFVDAFASLVGAARLWRARLAHRHVEDFSCFTSIRV